MRKKNGTDSKDMEQVQVKALPVKYIKQPYPITAMQANLSMQQIKILVGMMQQIQDRIQDFLSNKRQSGQLSLFEDVDSPYVHIVFKFSDVVERPDYYKDAEKVAEQFMDIVFRYEDKEMGEITLTHFVDKVTFPTKGSKRDSICFTFTKEQAVQVFNFTMFSKYLKSGVFNTKSKYAARLYMLFSTSRGYEKDGLFHYYIKYKELRRIFGCDEKTPRGTWQQVSQKEYKLFKSNILKTAQKEMKEMSEAGKCDCWFEYKELPEDWKGEPESFDFIIHLNEIGRLEGGKSEAMKARKKVEELLKEKFSLTERECGKILDGLESKEELCRLEDRVAEIAEAIQKKGDAIKNVKLYAKKSLSEAVKDIVDARNVQVVEVKEATQEEHSADANPTECTAQETTMTVEQVRDVWHKVFGMKDYIMWLSSKEISVADGCVTVVSPHKDVTTKLEEWRNQLEESVRMKLLIKERYK